MTSLRALAQLAGVACAYKTYEGANVEASHDTVIGVLDGMELPASTPSQIKESFARVAQVRRAPMPPLVIASQNAPPRITLRKSARDETIEWRLTREDGETLEGRAAINDTPNRSFNLPVQPQGYHLLEAAGARTHLICAPARCWTPDCLNTEAKLWGVSAQAYGLRSARDFGIGGFTEIAHLARSAGERGASFLGLSPLHALLTSDRTRYSPYSPSNRLMLDPIFIDPRRAPGFAGSIAEQIYSSPEYQRQLAELRQKRLVDYQRSWSQLCALLEPAWLAFRQSGDAESFTAFRANMGAALEDHALFEALSERYAQQGANAPLALPLTLNSSAAMSARQQLSERISYYAWLQWIADGQLKNSAETALSSGMEIGLYRDLAVGAHRGGSEIWRDPTSVLNPLSIGAPPDSFGPQGQNWDLPPLDPIRLETEGLGAFKALVRANMRYAGALRLDHAFQLARLFLIPRGGDANQGTYVAYPLQGLLACLRIESHRAKALVVAEDLGTAPHGFTDAIMNSGLLSYKLLMFERDENGGFNQPQTYPRQALASVATHDLPTLIGWRRGLDIEMRDCFFSSADEEAAHMKRAHEMQALDDALGAEKLLVEPTNAINLRNSVFRFLARTPTLLLSLQVDDIVGEAHQANMPGPDHGYPNWRRRMRETLEGLTEPAGPLAQTAAVMTLERRGLRLHESALASEPPRALYRLQFNPEFNFDDAARVAPYLKRIGVSHIYASPIHCAAPGSTHGYDVIDYTRINPALGGEDGFKRMSETLKTHGVKLLLDIVPNHMSTSTDESGANEWWLSTLEWGRASPHACVFDIDWSRRVAHGKILLPCLNQSLRDTLAQGLLQLRFNRKSGSLFFHYETHRFPLHPFQYASIFEEIKKNARGLERAIATFRNLPRTPKEKRIEITKEAKRQLVKTVQQDEETAALLDSALSEINLDYDRLKILIHHQNYRLAHWRMADCEINYRRFFDVNCLIGVRIEDPNVFDIVHAQIFKLIKSDSIHGLRIDHVDGLADPAEYISRLQERLGPGFYIIVEKILGEAEHLRPWQASGETGYKALNQLDGIFINQNNEAAFDALYCQPRYDGSSFDKQLQAIKIQLLNTTFVAELHLLVDHTLRLTKGRDLTPCSVAHIWTQLIATLPVYRSYLARGKGDEEDRRLLAKSLDSVAATCSSEHAETIMFLWEILTNPTTNNEIIDLHMRFQQLSGPVMAKSLEDTLFYRYARFVALNEVGGAPERFGISVMEFHAENEQRAYVRPYGLVATQTHDTKRGEDLRARLLALSHAPELWCEFLEAARSGGQMPDGNDQYFLLQNMIGAWPVSFITGEPRLAGQDFISRMKKFATKALRESKRRSSWIKPDSAYEAATQIWIETLCADENFLTCIMTRMGLLARAGFSISLARTALKFTIPGIPDIYQGCEGADFSLVDPDNRRPVDFSKRAKMLEGDKPHDFEARKQQLIVDLLADRKASPKLYTLGNYEPLAAPSGWVAFRRSHRHEALLVAARIDPFTSTLAPAWAQPDKYWRNLLLSPAFDGIGSCCVSGAAFILKSALHESADESAKP